LCIPLSQPFQTYSPFSVQACRLDSDAHRVVVQSCGAGEVLDNEIDRVP
jgi:hypothetical protein